jgi:hypothetical protein
MFGQNKMDIDRVTPSMLKKFEECPLSFFYNYVLGIKLEDQQKMHFDFGTAVHAGIDMIYEQMDETTGWDYADFSLVKEVFIKLFPSTSVTPDPKFPTEKERLEKWAEMRKNGVDLLKAYWDEKEELYAAGVNPKEFEVMMKFVPFNPETREELEVPLSLRIDGLNREGKRIFEFKTSASKYDEVDTRNLPQTLAYVWAMYCKTGEVFGVDYIVLLKNHKKNRIQHLHYEYDLADVLAFDERVRTIIGKIKTRNYDLHQFCRVPYCDCRKFHDLLDVSDITLKNGKN